MIIPDRNEICRYLGLKNRKPDSETEDMIAYCTDLLNRSVSPVSLHRSFPLSFEDGYPVIEGTVIRSEHLKKNLKGCGNVILMLVSLGAEADRLIRRSEMKSSFEGAVMSACASAMAEAYCDSVNEEIRGMYLAKNLYTRPRFSPGYGDFDLAYQKLFFDLLNITVRTGIILNDSLMMVPVKSITALIGLSFHNTPCILQGCEVCESSDTCPYSRAGGII